MKPTEELSQFVRAGLAAGRDDGQLRVALTEAGWTGREVEAALSGWTAAPGLPPVPRPQPFVSAREALLYGLLFISLGMVAWHLIDLGFDLIDQLVPDIADLYLPRGSMRWSIAALIVFLPLFLLLNARVNRATQGDPGRRRSLVRKWFASVTLLIAGLVLLGDLVVSVYALLSGELTLRFAAKAGLVALVGGLVLAYYRDEMDE